MAAKAKFDDPEVLSIQIETYFEKIKENAIPPTLSGLAYVLGVTRKTLGNYIRDAEREDVKGKSKKAECGRLLMMAKARIECWLEEKMVTEYSKGYEFVLKNGYGWGDKATVEVEGDVEHGGAVSVIDATKLTDEELIRKIELLTARADEIRRREGVNADSG